MWIKLGKRSWYLNTAIYVSDKTFAAFITAWVRRRAAVDSQIQWCQYNGTSTAPPGGTSTSGLGSRLAAKSRSKASPQPMPLANTLSNASTAGTWQLALPMARPGPLNAALQKIRLHHPLHTDMFTLSALLPMAPAFNAGLALSLSLIMALGAQNTHVIRMGLQGQHVVLTAVVCIASDILLIGLGVLAMAELGGLSVGFRPLSVRRAWLDTAVLIGTASLAWGIPGNAAFGAGAAAGSALWFCALSLGVFWLGQRLQNPAIWRALDGMVALMMWGSALALLWDLLAP